MPRHTDSYFVDLPKVINQVANPLGTPFLWWDAQNILKWFGARDLRTEKSDPDSPFPLPRKTAHAA